MMGQRGRNVSLHAAVARASEREQRTDASVTAVASLEHYDQSRRHLFTGRAHGQRVWEPLMWTRATAAWASCS